MTVKVTKELAEFLNNYRDVCMNDVHWKDTLIVDHALAYANGIEFEEHVLNELQPIELATILANGWEEETGELEDTVVWTEKTLPKKFKFTFGHEEFLAVKDTVNGNDVLLVSWVDEIGERYMIAHILKDKIVAINEGFWKITEILDH